MDSNENLLRYGRAALLARPLPLRAGPFTLIFEPDSAVLRYIRLGDHEVVRAIYGAVRDQNWDTIQPRLSNLQVQSRDDSCHLTFECECKAGGIDFVWRGEIRGEPDGKITYHFRGEARSAFLRNRIGLCVLHPMLECAGKPCTIEKVDGSRQEAVFPKLISPWQPFEDVRAVAYEAAPGQKAEVRFAGDTFEMEDQRNWTDASFKTYSTPLRLPLPAQVEQGARVEQTVEVRLLGEKRKVLPVLLGRGAQLSIATSAALPKPSIGVMTASHGRQLMPTESERLRALRLGHVRVDLSLGAGNYRVTLEQAAREADALGTGLHVALTLSDDGEAELKSLSQTLPEVKPRVSLWLVFHRTEVVTSEKWVRLARQILQAYAPNVLIAAGTKQWFTELNRNRPPADATALPCYTLNPQVHAFDNRTLVENIAGQVATVETAKSFSSRPVVISPITLRPRVTGEGQNAARERDLKETDPRQMSLLGAAWTLASIARLSATGGVHSLTYYETTGARGVMAPEDRALLPDDFPAAPGTVYPVYHLLADMAGFEKLHATHSDQPLLVEGMTLLDAQNRRRILVGNLLPETQEVKIKTGTCQARVRYLDETNVEAAARIPEKFREENGSAVESVSGKIELKLLPYAVARVDIL